MICVNVLRPFAIEHFLKGLSVNTAGGYRRSHDLVQLYDDLRPEVQAISEKLAAAEGLSRFVMSSPGTETILRAGATSPSRSPNPIFRPSTTSTATYGRCTFRKSLSGCATPRS